MSKPEPVLRLGLHVRTMHMSYRYSLGACRIASVNINVCFATATRQMENSTEVYMDINLTN